MTRNEMIDAIERKTPVVPFIGRDVTGTVVGWVDADHVRVRWSDGTEDVQHFEELSEA